MSPQKKKPTASKKKTPAGARKPKRGAGPAKKARAGKKPVQRRGGLKEALRKARPPKKARGAAPPAAPAENPAAKALARRIAELILEKKGTEILILDVRGKTSYADYFVLASGESDRQVSAMADHVTARLKEEGERPVGTEGEDTGNWVLLDYGEVVAHLFFTEVRSFYDLEGLWADAPREQVA